jgi:integral membrane sensor domain MASE1
VAVLVCSTMLTSAPRYALTWFPAYVLLAQLVVRPRWRWPTIALAAVCLPLLAVLSLAFAAHQWVS